MKTLQEKYNAILENKFSKTQFVRDAKLQLPNLISQFNGFEDTIQILKNKGMIQEATKVPEVDVEKNYSLDVIERGIDAELEKMGIDTVETVKEKDYEKAKAKALKNLAKDCNYYLHLLSGDSKKVDKHDQMTPATAKNTVDTFNGLKKATLKENISKYIPAIKKITSYSDVQEDPDPHFTMGRGELVWNYLTQQFPELGKVGEKEWDIVNKLVYQELKNKGLEESKIEEFSPHGTPAFEKGANSMREHPRWDDLTADEIDAYIKANPTSLWGRSLSIAKMVRDRKREAPNEMKHPSYPKATNQYQGKVDGLNHHKKLTPAGREEHRKERQAWIKRMKEKGLFDLGEDTINETNVNPEVTKLVNRFIGGLAKRYDYSTQDAVYALMQVLRSQKWEGINETKTLEEGRIKKIKGGKIVKEDDYATGGYVESMGPRLEKAIKHLLAVWDEWKSGPMTEPGMIPHAKKDLVDYLASNLQEVEDSTDDLENTTSNDAAYKAAFDIFDPEEEKIKEQLKETFKRMIAGILTEDKKLLKEAKAENLERFINYENSDNEDLAARIRKGATELADHIAKIEKNYLDTRQGIENIYTNIGPFMAPSVSNAFKQDLAPILKKYTSIEVPKSKKLSPEELEQMGHDPNANMYKMNENKSPKTKYTKRKK